MSKLFMVKLHLELADDAPLPDEDEWATLAIQSVSGITGIGDISFELLPYGCLEDCPAITHTYH